VFRSSGEDERIWNYYIIYTISTFDLLVSKEFHG
jgi:hypothetical protein